MTRSSKKRKDHKRAGTNRKRSGMRRPNTTSKEIRNVG